MNSIFKNSIQLNKKIEKFLTLISESLLLFDKGVQLYLNNKIDEYKVNFERISKLESEADALENDIKTSLYVNLLLPDMRADVLSLIKSLDDLIDATEDVTKAIYIEKPSFPDSLHESIINLTHQSIQSAEALIHGTSAFFNEAHLVSSYINKINFYEHEADILEDSINTIVFNENIVESLAEKIHIRTFICKIASISDISESVGEKLTIFSIKREI